MGTAGECDVWGVWDGVWSVGWRTCGRRAHKLMDTWVWVGFELVVHCVSRSV